MSILHFVVQLEWRSQCTFNFRSKPLKWSMPPGTRSFSHPPTGTARLRWRGSPAGGSRGGGGPGGSRTGGGPGEGATGGGSGEPSGDGGVAGGGGSGDGGAGPPGGVALPFFLAAPATLFRFCFARDAFFACRRLPFSFSCAYKRDSIAASSSSSSLPGTSSGSATLPTSPCPCWKPLRTSAASFSSMSARGTMSASSRFQNST